MQSFFQMTKAPIVEDFNEWTRNNSGVMIIKFCAGWSGPCHIMEPIFKELSLVYEKQASFYEIDVDIKPQLKSELGITEIPTILFYRKGILCDFITGLISREAFMKKLENVIKE